MQYKYLQIEEYIKSQFLEGKLKVGEKISSESELSKQFKLSRQTVRTAINNLVSSGLLRTIQGKGTFILNNKTGKTSTYTIGFATARFNTYSIFPKIIAGINNKTISEGYRLLIDETQNTVEGEYSCLKNFLSKGIDALIIDPSKSALPSPNIEIYREFARRGIPVLFYNGHPAGLDSSFIKADDQQGGYLATKHLLDYGHRNIGGIFKSDDMQGHERYQGFISAFREFGLPIPENNILWFSSEEYPYLWNSTGENLTFYDSLILDKIKKCTALVVYNDYVAASVIKLLKKCDIKFPDSLSLVSFDDTDLTLFCGVPITSILHPSLVLGEKLGTAVLELIKDPSKMIRQVIPTSIVLMESTRRIT